MNDFFRFMRTPLGIDVTVGSKVFRFNEGYVVLDGPPADEALAPVMSIWGDPSTGKVRIKDSAGVRDL
jgi:hypothetical protein